MLRYYIGKMMVLVSLTAVISVFTTLYPIALGKFTRQPTFMEIIVGILSHSIAGLFLVIAVSLSGAGIIHFLPSQSAFAGWMLPPVYRIMDVLNNYETSSESEIALAILLPGLYSILMFSIFLMWMKKKLF